MADLEKALPFAENLQQKAVIEELVKFYRTGSLKTFDDYSILWAEDTDSQVDFINGFIESYGDPLGMTGSWESIVNFRDEKSSARTRTLASSAQWFEDHSPVDPKFRKPEVKGVSAKGVGMQVFYENSNISPKNDDGKEADYIVENFCAWKEVTI